MVRHFAILCFLVNLSACISHQYKPEKDQLITTADCSNFSGQYVFADSRIGERIYKHLFEDESEIEVVLFEVTDSSVEISGIRNQQVVYQKTLSRFRSSCSGSVLTLITKDEYSSDGLVMTASDQKIEFFFPGKDILRIRLIDTGLAFFFIIPFYSSTDDVLDLKIIE
jgi:hypothetical protein